MRSRIAFGVAKTIALFDEAQREQFERGNFARVPLYRGASGSLELAAFRTSTVLISTVTSGREEVEADLLKKWLQFWLDSVTPLHIGIHVVNDETQKAALCKELGIGLIVDESEVVVSGARELGIDAIQFASPSCKDHDVLKALIEQKLPRTRR